MYISHIKLSNVRCFANTGASFDHPDAGHAAGDNQQNVNLILGNNGTGKTTLLKTIALAVLTPIIKDCGYVSHRMVRENATKGWLEGSLLVEQVDLGIKAATSWTTRLELKRIGERESLEIGLPDNRLSEQRGEPEAQKKRRSYYFKEDHPSYFLVGYGATRRMETGEFNLGSVRKRRHLRYHRVASLFEDHEALIPMDSWLPDFRDQSKRYEEIIGLINKMLPEGTMLTDRHKDGEYFFKHQNIDVPFSALSDGYRAYIAWVTDLTYHLSTCAPSGLPLTEMRGVVLVDEVDLHLHPEWQREVIDLISQNLPKLQFIFTSHSPIVAGSVKKPPLLIEREVDAMIIKKMEEKIHGRNADQILLSPYFGLESTRAEGVEQELIKLARQADTGNIEAAKTYLRKMAGGN